MFLDIGKNEEDGDGVGGAHQLGAHRPCQYYQNIMKKMALVLVATNLVLTKRAIGCKTAQREAQLLNTGADLPTQHLIA